MLIRSGSSPRPLRLALAQLTGTVLALGAIEIALVVAGPVRPVWVLVLFPVVAWIYVGIGIGAWLRRPGNRMGALMTAAGLLWLGAGLVNTGVPALIAAGQILATMPLAVVIHMLLGFPSGRLRDTWSRVTVWTGYAVALVLQAPLYAFAAEQPPYDVLQIASRPALLEAGLWLQRGAGIIVVAATAVILASRLRDARPPQRRVLAPLAAYGIVAVLFIPVSANVLLRLVGIDVPTLVALQLAVLALVPILFECAVALGGFARTAEIEELGTWLGADAGGRPGLAEALARTLGDESLELAFWLPERSGYVDPAGATMNLPRGGSDRAAVEVELGGRRVGAIVYDASLIAEPELVRAAGRVVAIELDRERLTAELLASRDALRRSRERLLEAEDAERRRIARDLHDGLQSQLVLLGLEADGIASDELLTADTRKRAARLRSGLDGAVTDLRRLVQDVMPAALVERGLYAASEDLVDRLPIPTRLELDGDDRALPARVESAAYFILAEGVANAIKHSRARELEIGLERSNECLRIEIRDDGVGGAAAGAGAGLRALADRVDVVGGRLSVGSPPGGGTRIVAEVPCAS